MDSKSISMVTDDGGPGSHWYGGAGRFVSYATVNKY